MFLIDIKHIRQNSLSAEAVPSLNVDTTKQSRPYI
jgi:hypothetical protein